MNTGDVVGELVLSGVDYAWIKSEDCTAPQFWHLADRIFRAKHRATLRMTRAIVAAFDEGERMKVVADHEREPEPDPSIPDTPDSARSEKQPTAEENLARMLREMNATSEK